MAYAAHTARIMSERACTTNTVRPIDELLERKKLQENELNMIKSMHKQVFGNEKAASEQSLFQLAGLLQHISEVIKSPQADATVKK